MAKKLTISQIEKYDITQKIFSELVNLESRLILFSTKTKARTTFEIFQTTKIPLSSMYKKLRDLENLGLIMVEKIDFSDNGKREKYYRSRISGANITIHKLEPKLFLKKMKALENINRKCQ